MNNDFCGASLDCLDANAGEECGPGTICTDGVCELTCVEGFLACGGVCTDPDTNRAFCGAVGDCSGENAGTVCAADEVCSDGVCGSSCREGQIVCGGSCVDPFTNPGFCGAVDDCLGANAGEACAIGEGCLGGTCRSAMITLTETDVFDAIERGWWASDGSHVAANNNTFTGFSAGLEYNSFFTFDLLGTIEDADAVLSVTLRLEVEAYFSADSSNDFTVWDVTTDAVTLDTDATTNVAVHTDLESGVSYGTGTVFDTSIGDIIEVTLGAAAAADILDAAGGPFSIGIVNDTVTTTGNDGWRWSGGGESRVHQIIVTYTTAP